MGSASPGHSARRRHGRGFTRYSETRYDAGWYERLVTVPEAWKGRRISLVFDYLGAYVARVFVDGKLAAHFEQTRPGEALLYPARRVDLSEYAGQTVRVSLQVGWDSPGTCDLLSVSDAWLVAEPGWVDVESVFPVTRIRPRKQITVSAVLRNAGREPVEVLAGAEARGKEQVALALPAQRVRLAPGEAKEVRWQSPWPDARVWSPDAPYLYSLAVTLKTPAGGALKEASRRLGFRELWIEGRDFVLNGRKVHLRGSNCNLPFNYEWSDPEYLRRTYAARKELGYNLIQYWSDAGVSAMGGLSYGLERALELCDEMGFVAAVGNVSHLLDVKDETAYRKTVEEFTRKYGAHASVCFWFVSPNTCWYNYGMHPGNLDCAYAPEGSDPGFANQGMARAAPEATFPTP